MIFLFKDSNVDVNNDKKSLNNFSFKSVNENEINKKHSEIEKVEIEQDTVKNNIDLNTLKSLISFGKNKKSNENNIDILSLLQKSTKNLRELPEKKNFLKNETKKENKISGLSLDEIEKQISLLRNLSIKG